MTLTVPDRALWAPQTRPTLSSPAQRCRPGLGDQMAEAQGDPDPAGHVPAGKLAAGREGSAGLVQHTQTGPAWGLPTTGGHSHQ